jgi:hypothetical protein
MRPGGDFEAITDLGSPFAVDMIKAYLDAKAVIVQRKFETWWPSFVSECLDWRFFPGAEVATWVSSKLGLRSSHALSKIYFGLFHASSVDEIHQNARKTYDQYFEDVRRAVPASRRLEYRLGDGWEPLCTFLGKDIPDVPFPNVNDRIEHKRIAQRHTNTFLLMMLRQIVPWIIGIFAII